VNDNPYTEGRRRKDYVQSWGRRPVDRPAPILVSCHFCGNQWDPKNRIFICPKCHTTYNPQKSPLIGFAGEIRVARLRENMTQPELAKKIGCALHTLTMIEAGREAKSNSRGKIIREKLRIWIESTKSPIERRQEIENMFNSTESETK
jgi:DNA-binding XRE family transcriptional regulator